MRPPPARRRGGFSLVELLVAAAVAGIVLAVVVAFFVHNTNLTRRTQAQHEVETKVKSVAELVAQDLQLAGSRVVVNDGVSTTLSMPCSSSAATKCVDSVGGGGGTLDDLTLYYATSLRPTAPCRRVDYRVSAGALQRSEVTATAFACPNLSAASPNFTSATLASNVDAFDLAFLCADESAVDDPADCYTAGTFPRRVTVAVTARSDLLSTVTASIELNASMPNLR